MKRKIALILSVLLLFCSCKEAPQKELGKYASFSTSGVWLSFSEINNMLISKKGFEAELEETVENCEQLHIENVYIHVRSYCDSLYPSEFFPLISKAQAYNYDIFQKMLDAFHQSGIKVHAWINPYRVLTSSADIDALRTDSPAYKWLKDESEENDVNVCFYKGIYLNPAETEVQKLILDGIKEIINRYNVDGIHFDDYFYPTQSADFDKAAYEKYKQNAEIPLELSDWRRSNVNALISNCYSAIKYKNKDIVFSISPAASVERNYNEFYADIEEWIVNGYVDAIIPQLYFGFNYNDKSYQFDSLLKNWLALCEKNTDVDLLIGLGSYKIGTFTDADGIEWQTDTDIIARQVKKCYQNDKVKGYVIFSYSSIFSDNSLNAEQRSNLLEFIKSTENS